MPRASVIVVNYNSGTGALGNVRRLVDQASAEDAEVLVVDNASQDGSAERIAEIPGIRLLREEANGGFAAGVNRGLREASGSVIVVVNPDAAPRPGALAALVAAVAGHPDFALLGGLVVRPSGAIDANAFRRLPRPLDILREGILFLPPRAFRGRPPGTGIVEVEAVSGSVMALSRDTLEALGPMPEEYFLYDEDLDWCRRARRLGRSVGVVADAVFEHSGGASTGGSEGPAFAARVLADFQYFCEGEGVPAERVRRLWRARLVFRSWLYRSLALLGPRSSRGRSRRRAAVYRILSRELRAFEWTPDPGGRSAHPSRLADLPSRPAARDRRPLVLELTTDMEYGGVQRLIERVVRGPLSREFRFEILCLRRIGEIGEGLRRDGVRVHVAGMAGWWNPFGWRRALDYAALIEPDLVHSYLMPGDLAARLGFPRTPWISTKPSVDLSMPGAIRALERLVHLRTDLVVAVGDAVARAKRHLSRDGMLPAVIEIPPGVAVASTPAPLLPPGREIRLAVVGRLHRVKRVDLFLETAAALERERPGAFAYRVVGDGPERDRLRGLAASLGLGARVEFRGAPADVAPELDWADVVLLLSDFEGVPITALETMARGRIPVVRLGPGTGDALPPFLERCALESDDPSDFARKVLEVADARADFRALAERARAWISARPSYSAVLGAAYRRVLESHGPRSRARVLDLITRLIVGGAQETAISMVERVDPDRYDSSLWIGPQTGSEGSLLEDARGRGIVVRILPNMVREVSPWKDLVVLCQLVRHLRRERFDIVHTHSSKAGVVGSLAARIAGVPHVVHTVHGWGFHEHMSPAARRFYVFLERFMARRTDVLVPVSAETMRIGIAERIGRPERYRLIHSGIPLGEFSPDAERRERTRAALGVDPDAIVVGSVGRLSLQKNPLDFVRVAAGVARRHERAMFVYVGDGPLRGEVEAAIELAGLADRIQLLGLRDDVPDLLRAMDVVVLTSLWEGLPRVVLQALATGVPVFSYDTAGISEAVRDGVNGCIVPRGAVGEMAERLSDVLGDAAGLAALRRRAREELDPSFSEEGMIRDIEALYDELLSPAASEERTARRP
jgi:glycosyltransferase involved in cell wall biosynthesis